MTLLTVSKCSVGLLVSLLVAIVLSACGTTKSRTITLQPMDVLTTSHLDHEYEKNPVYGCLFTRGLQARRAPFNQVLVGFDDFWDPGTEPFPCYEKIDVAYRGAVRFDLPAVPHFVDATLHFDLLETRSPTIDLGSNTSCAARLSIATVDWSNGFGDLIPAEDFVTLPPDSAAGNVGVAPVVRQWLQGIRPNFGFVLVGRDEGTPQETKACLSRYGNFRLDLLVLQ